MSELLLELFCEEIPAKMQKNAALDLHNKIKSLLEKENINFGESYFHFTPRRIFVAFKDLPLKLDGITIEKRGPKTNAPQESIEGFAKSFGVNLSELTKIEFKGEEYYFARKEERERDSKVILKSILEEGIAAIKWPKSMKWNAFNMRFIRPLVNIFCIFNNEVLPIKFHHLTANDKLQGHRFLAPNIFSCTSYADYMSRMEEHFIIIDQEKRLDIIKRDARTLASSINCNLIEDENLFNEINGLVEYPVVLLGKIDESFMKLPKELLIITMKTHQRYLSLVDQNGQLAPYFIFASNIFVTPRSQEMLQSVQHDGVGVHHGTQELYKDIIAGNQKVLVARFNDAKYFFEKDLEQRLESYEEKLKTIMFHEKLGSIYDKVSRIEKIMLFLGEKLAVDKTTLSKIAHLSKCDLATSLVSEFPELQGVIGGYYAKLQNHTEDICVALSNQYKHDNLPHSLPAVILIIADRIDSLMGLWFASEQPTSSKDPFAMRRAALLITKILIDLKIDFDYLDLFKFSASLFGASEKIITEVQDFFNERVKYYLKDLFDITIVNAVKSTNIYQSYCSLQNLQNFLNTSNGKQALEIYKRCENIAHNYKKIAEFDQNLLALKEEKDLFNAIEKFDNSKLENLANLAAPINSFFDNIMVNDENEKIKNNRMLLLAKVISLFYNFADFSKLI